MTKMTKKDMFAMVSALVESIECENKKEMLDFLAHEIELLNKKSSKSTQTKTQKENIEIMETIKAELSAMTEPVTISELMAKSEKMAKYTNQKLSALLKKLVDMGEVVKTTEKKKSYFSIVEGV